MTACCAFLERGGHVLGDDRAERGGREGGRNLFAKNNPTFYLPRGRAGVTPPPTLELFGIKGTSSGLSFRIENLSRGVLLLACPHKAKRSPSIQHGHIMRYQISQDKEVS